MPRNLRKLACADGLISKQSQKNNESFSIKSSELAAAPYGNFGAVKIVLCHECIKMWREEIGRRGILHVHQEIDQS